MFPPAKDAGARGYRIWMRKLSTDLPHSGRDEGVTRKELQRVVDAGRVARVRAGWYCLPTERALLAIVRRQEHRWQSIHRSAGIAVASE
jgi:DNA-binding transcriptional regulator PaaX